MYARKEAEFAEQMKMKWEKVISGEFSDADIKDIIKWLTDNQKEDGAWNMLDTYYIDSDIRVAYGYVPTYMGSMNAKIVLLSNTFNPGNVHNQRRNGNISDLTSDSLLNKDGYSYNEDLLRIKNYAKCIQGESEDRDGTDEFYVKMMHGNWNAFSSGERARVLLLSRILSVFHVDEEFRCDDKVKVDESGNIMTVPSDNKKAEEEYLLSEPELYQDYIFLIDEAELYFHPNWQRTFIYDLNRYIEHVVNKYAKSVQNITIILSSNTPFYMSDLPVDDIHLIGDSREKSNSFGQNINTLLEEEFFLSNPMGKLANEKISEAFTVIHSGIDFYNGKTKGKSKGRIVSEEDQKAIEYLITIIGDRLLKRVLLDEWNFYLELKQRKEVN